MLCACGVCWFVCLSLPCLSVLLREGLEGHVPYALGDAHELHVEGVAQGEGVVLAGQPQPLHADGHLWFQVCVCEID